MFIQINWKKMFPVKLKEKRNTIFKRLKKLYFKRKVIKSVFNNFTFVVDGVSVKHFNLIEFRSLTNT